MSLKIQGAANAPWISILAFLKDRIIFIGTEITDHVANVVVAQLLFLRMEDAKKDVHVYINSVGGYITAGLAIYDTLQWMGCNVNTYCIGQASSMGALLLTAGTKGKRFALPNSRIMIHQPYGGVGGTSSDIALQAKEILVLKNGSTKSWPTIQDKPWRKSQRIPKGTSI